MLPLSFSLLVVLFAAGGAAADPARPADRLRRVRIEQAGPVTNMVLVEAFGARSALVIVHNKRQARVLHELMRVRDGAFHLPTNMTVRHCVWGSALAP